jgi:PIN domain nuclease of toxin-antitoxin system
MKEEILLDTQIIIWLENDFDKISNSTLEIILTSDLVISKVSIWEIAIKTKLGKLTIQKDLNRFIEDFTKDYSVHILDIKLPSIYHTQKMPFHHKDPFDRLIAVQAITENLQLLSSDSIFDLYNVNRIWQ